MSRDQAKEMRQDQALSCIWSLTVLIGPSKPVVKFQRQTRQLVSQERKSAVQLISFGSLRCEAVLDSAFVVVICGVKQT